MRVRFVSISMGMILLMQFIIIAFSSYRSYGRLETSADSLIDSIHENLLSEDGTETTEVVARYFYVVTDMDKIVRSVNNTNNRKTKTQDMLNYFNSVVDKTDSFGFVGSYRYGVYQDDDRYTYIFLLRNSNIDYFVKNTESLLAVSFLTLAIMLVFLIFISKQVVGPIAKSYKKQKEFITSAGHELKTPLTVIMADVDILQMEQKDNEWLQDIDTQAKRLAEMTNSLVSLARMDELEEHLNKIVFPISDVAEDVTHAYTALAISQNKQYTCEIEKDLSYCGDENAIRQLFTILLDNAFKYCSNEGEITFTLTKSGNGVEFKVKNTVDYIDKKSLDRMFDRFYRSQDTASTTKGFGLGLAIASIIVANHKGRIKAKAEDIENAVNSETNPKNNVIIETVLR